MKWTRYLAALLVVSTTLPFTLAWAAPRIDNGANFSNYYNASMTWQLNRDVAVTGIQSSRASVSQGDTVSIDVTVQNLGTGAETFTLTLRDETDFRDIQTVQLTLDAAQTLIIGLHWDTSSATPGAHSLSATATLANDQNPGNDSMSIASPVNVLAVGITIDTLAPADATFGEGLAMAQPNVTTQKSPLNTVFIGRHDASHAGSLVRAAVNTQGTTSQAIFVANAQATFQPSAPLQDPFRQGEIQGIIRLEGNPSSLGGYIQVGQNTHFVQSDGSFRVMVPGGTFDIFLKSPGYVAVQLPKTSINPGEVLTLPTLTLPFGDANGDGKIDILDLSMAASNFGDTVVQVPPP